MSGEPKTLTLEEALVLIARDTQYSLVAMPDEDSDEPVALSWVLLGAFDDFGPFTSWVQAAEHALGVPVVARDEAAELRAATKRLLAALDARDHFIEREEELPHDEWDIAYRRTGDDITNALAVLRRLAGGENEK